MPDQPIWEVALYVDGPVTVRQRFTTKQQKGFRLEDPFYSDIEIAETPSGLRSLLTARAANHDVAYKAAVHFFGHMIDSLTMTINRPMRLSVTQGEKLAIRRHDVRRRIEPREFEAAFKDAHFLGQVSRSFLRSLGWYRKGLTADDPLDKFLAFWNAIEIVASKFYHTVPSIDQERARRGCKNQVWACFEALWGQCDTWPVINGQTKWINESYEIRMDVAHGLAFIDIHKIADVAAQLPSIEQVCYRFLTGWRERFSVLDRHPPNENLPADSFELLPE
jgi:hypothetical protein